MQPHTSKWADIFANPQHTTEYKLSVAGVEYTGEALATGTLTLSRALFAENVTVGCVGVSLLDVTIFPTEPVPRMAELALYARLVGAETSEWIPQGRFFIDTRKNWIHGGLSLTCYDRMLMTEQPYIDPDNEGGEWPIPMRDAVAEICTRIGAALDSRTVLREGSGYVVDYPNDFTMREVLGYIGVAHGGNWVMTPAGALRLVPLATP